MKVKRFIAHTGPREGGMAACAQGLCRLYPEGGESRENEDQWACAFQ